MAEAIQIGILGDYDAASPNLPAVEQSIEHAGAQLKMTAAVEWLPTDSLLTSELDKKLEVFDGLWAGPGSPYKNLEGMLRGIEFARRRDWPFVGT